jgi:subtilisin family serine protease
MKLKLLASSIALICTQLSAQTTGAWETGEYYKSRTLAPIKASTAYARGYTGKGSLIAVLDSGIDVTNEDFKNGKILFVKDFSNSGSIVDRVGHGTHVAGIAAGAKNGFGTHGVAFDANLIIGKVTNNGMVTINSLIPAVQWAAGNKADAINLSINFKLTQSALKAQMVSPGVYRTSHTNTNTLPGGLNAQQWAAALSGETVLVVAAGNDNTPWAGGLSQLAAVTDSKGNLLLGGKMIVAGNWNSQTNRSVGPNNNGAAQLCMVMVGTTCQDKYKVSDFYLLAPGTGITSSVPTTVNKSGLSTMTGTSMAAPAISGGVAIVHQMWPQMTGANIVRLLLVTANKNLPGYSVTTMGQGMMDLDRATRPVGAVGIPTTGRLGGATVANVGPIIVTGGSAGTGRTTNLMVVDSFERDFYVNSKVLTAYNKPASFNAVQASMPYSTQNNYALFNNYTDQNRVRVDNVEVAMYRDNVGTPGMVEVALNKTFGNVNVRYSGGAFSEANTWLGNSVAGFNGQGNNMSSTTQFVGVGASYESGNTKLYANAQHGVTFTRANSDNVKNISPALSYSWTLGAEHKLDGKNTVGMMAYQPVSVYHARADITAPVGLDSEFNIIQQHRGNLAADVREVRTGFYYKFSEKNSTNVTAFLENRQNFRGQEGVKDHALGFVVNQRF